MTENHVTGRIGMACVTAILVSLIWAVQYFEYRKTKLFVEHRYTRAILVGTYTPQWVLPDSLK